MSPIEMYCPNIQILADFIGEDEALAITKETCDIIACITCPLHDCRFTLEKAKRSEKKRISDKEMIK